jgi:hypothetical protein
MLLSPFLRLPKSGTLGSCILFPQEQGSPVIQAKVKVRVTLRPTTSRPVYLGVRHPQPNFLLSLIILRQLRIYSCGAPSLTRSRICSIQFLLGITSAASLKSLGKVGTNFAYKRRSLGIVRSRTKATDLLLLVTLKNKAENEWRQNSPLYETNSFFLEKVYFQELYYR